MLNNEFRDEVHQYIDYLFDKSDEYKNILREIYLKVYEITTSNNIPCYAAFGTCLGAIRDNLSIIPWDMDIDVAVPVTYRKKLIEILNKLDSGYKWIGIENCKKYPVSEIRVFKDGMDPDEFHVDVFFLIGCPNNEKNRTKFSKKVANIFSERLYKYRDLSNYKKSNKFLYMLKLVQNHIKGICPLKILNYRYEKILYKYSYDMCEYIMYMCEGSKPMKKELFDNINLKYYEGLPYFMPNNYDEYLSLYYGEYSSYFPIKNRFEELYYGVERKLNSK